jgi:hypothetical protein
MTIPADLQPAAAHEDPAPEAHVTVAGMRAAIAPVLEHGRSRIGTGHIA